MDYRQDIDVQKTFYKPEISQAILSLFMLLVAFDVFRNMNAIIPQNRWCYYITAIVYCVGGIASVIVSFMTKKLPDAKFCVFADGRGIFNPMINYFNMLFAFFFVILTGHSLEQQYNEFFCIPAHILQDTVGIPMP